MNNLFSLMLFNLILLIFQATKLLLFSLIAGFYELI